MGGLILEAEGADGTIRLYTDRVEIDEHRFLEPLRTGTKTNMIPLRELGNIEYMSPGRIRPGKLKLMPSGVESSDSDIHQGKYEITFNAGNDTFPELRDELEKYRGDAEIQGRDVSTQFDTTTGDDPVKILNRRYARGEISEDEYEKKRRRLEDN
ncbi:SHOCT domain-containing protein [Salarchaeum sp. III]|uniref:SHOCT domain-containing protein n=1 Tax=Salarchaeum sp. III TaxID=3107927 RepID=UPI002ED88654